MIAGLEPNNSNQNQELWETIEKIETKTGLEITESLDSIEIDYNLPETIPALTETKEYSKGDRKTKIKFNSNCDYLPENIKEEIAIHEAIHVLDHNNKLIDQLDRKKGISDDFRKELQRNFLYGDEDRKEGTTQLIASKMSENENNYFYPYETNKIQQEMIGKDINVESELLEDVKSFEEDILEQYSGIYGSEVNQNNLYVEEGYVGEIEYRLEIYDENLGVLYFEEKDKEELFNESYLER